MAEEIAGAYEELIERFVAWARPEEAIRAAVVIGSRARTDDHPADEWADLDILIWSTDPAPYLAGRDWTATLGEAWISFEDAHADPRIRELRVLFAGGLDVDFAFVKPAAASRPDESLAGMARVIFRRGARVLLDRDGEIAGMLSAMPPPPAPGAAQDAAARDVALPDAAAFDQVASDFWYHAVWTAKHLRRGELWWAKGGCDGRLKELLQVALEWDAAAKGRDHWFRGRYLEEWADPVVVRGLGRAFARYDEDEVWAALGVTMDLFSRIAGQLAARLELPYPQEAEDRARELVRGYAAAQRQTLRRARSGPRVARAV